MNMKATEKSLGALNTIMDSYPIQSATDFSDITNYRTYVVEEMSNHPYELQFVGDKVI